MGFASSRLHFGQFSQGGTLAAQLAALVTRALSVPFSPSRNPGDSRGRMMRLMCACDVHASKADGPDQGKQRAVATGTLADGQPSSRFLAGARLAHRVTGAVALPVRAVILAALCLPFDGGFSSPGGLGRWHNRPLTTQV